MSLSPVTRSGLPEKVMPGVVRRKVTSSVNRRGCWLRWVVQKARKPRADPMRSAKLVQAGWGSSRSHIGLVSGERSVYMAFSPQRTVPPLFMNEKLQKTC